jgi:hypothetical protein
VGSAAAAFSSWRFLTAPMAPAHHQLMALGWIGRPEEERRHGIGERRGFWLASRLGWGVVDRSRVSPYPTRVGKECDPNKLPLLPLSVGPA